MKINVGLVGLGKMGLSHFSMINAHRDVNVVGVCDASNYLRAILGKYTGVTTYSDIDKMLDIGHMDAAIISTPSKFHAPMVRSCLERGLHVFCEKPFCLDPTDSRELADLARSKDLITQVGYHNRHVGTFAEVKRILGLGVLGRVTHVLGEAYGPVVLKPKGTSWRSKRDEGGGALYDYAAHPADLLTWYFGRPESISGTVLGRVFSSETEDEVFTTIRWPDGVSGQLSVNWSDESQRKMTTRISIWGTNGKIAVDRQEVQVYLRDPTLAPTGYGRGWTVRYTTELTNEVDFYVRGEEYSAQLDAWVNRILDNAVSSSGDFTDATITDELLFAIHNGSDGGVYTVGVSDDNSVAVQSEQPIGFLRRVARRLRSAQNGRSS